MGELQKENDLFYVCSLIENVARTTKNTKKYIVDKLGRENIKKYISWRKFIIVKI